MITLNLPSYDFSIRPKGEQYEIFDRSRGKYVLLTPEEWVRQNFVQYLIDQKNYPQSLIAVEKELSINKLKRRPDIVAFNRNHRPLLVVECKAPHIQINQDTFDQIARYNIALRVKYLVVTNGLQHYCCEIINEREYAYIKDIPLFNAH